MPGLVHPSSDACESISARLSGLEDLRLPAALLRQHPYPDPNCVRAHLQELLQRDAAVFLEVREWAGVGGGRQPVTCPKQMQLLRWRPL